MDGSSAAIDYQLVEFLGPTLLRGGIRQDQGT
jgi:hypothetical protein